MATRPPVTIAEYAKFIAHKSEKLGSEVLRKHRWTELSVLDFSRKLFHNLGETGPRL